MDYVGKNKEAWDEWAEINARTGRQRHRRRFVLPADKPVIPMMFSIRASKP